MLYDQAMDCMNRFVNADEMTLRDGFAGNLAEHHSSPYPAVKTEKLTSKASYASPETRSIENADRISCQENNEDVRLVNPG